MKADVLLELALSPRIYQGKGQMNASCGPDVDTREKSIWGQPSHVLFNRVMELVGVDKKNSEEPGNVILNVQGPWKEPQKATQSSYASV